MEGQNYWDKFGNKERKEKIGKVLLYHYIREENRQKIIEGYRYYVQMVCREF